MTLKEIRAYTGLTQAKFSGKYHIPLRVVESWESNSKSSRRPPEYVLEYLAHLSGYEINQDWVQEGPGI